MFFKRSTTIPKKEIVYTSQVSKYKKIINKIPYDIKVEKFKATILLLILFTFENFKNFKEKEVRRQLIQAEDNFDRFRIYRYNLKPSKKEKVNFANDVKNISIFFQKNPSDLVDKFKNHISSYFPKIDSDLLEDFSFLQNFILLSTKNDQFDCACYLLLDSLTCVTMNTKRNDIFKEILKKNEKLTRHHIALIKSLLSLNYSQSINLIQNLDLFLWFLKDSPSINKNNKCVRLIEEFRIQTKKKLIESAHCFQVLGQNLSISEDSSTKHANFIKIFTFILYARVFKTNLGEEPAFKFVELLNKFHRMTYDKSLLSLAQDCYFTYNKIKSFMIDLNTGRILRKVDFISEVTQFIDDIFVLFDNAYFVALMCAYQKRNCSDIYGFLINYLKKAL